MEKINRFNILYILLTLKNHSSEKHPLSIAEITDYVNKDYYRAIYDGEVSINSSTVNRLLESLFRDVSLGFHNKPMVLYDDNAGFGFNLYCVMQGNDGQWENYVASNTKRGGPTKYYYYESVFSDAELITLIDSVETYNYFSTDDIAGLVTKLLKLRPKSELLNAYHERDGHLLKDDDSLVLLNIDTFSRILKSQQFAKITYCNYDYHHNLIPREGYPRIIRPLNMMWSNGYYYLVALLKPGYTPANLRMDRIIDIEPIQPSADMLRQFQVDVNLEISTYRMNHPVMHGGKVRHIAMLYLDSEKNGMSNAIMDTFGKISQIRPATAEELKNNLPPSILADRSAGTWLHADFQATTAGTELFATQYCRYCKVISPTSLSEKVADNLKCGLQLY